MKTLYSIILLMLISTLAYSQAPEAFNYQALIRDGSGNILANAPVAIQISILQDSEIGSAVYVERFNPTTTAYGLIAVKIGKGSVQSGTFSSIDWGAHQYYIKTEVDIEDTIQHYYTTGFIQKEQLGKIEQMIDQVVKHPDLAPYFQQNNTVLNEREILTVTGEVIIPDRLVINSAKEAVIIDYKTGKSDKKYHQQLENYAATIQQLGFTVKKKLLVYISDSVKIEEV